MHAEVDHHIGLEAVLQPAVEGGVLRMGREVAFIHQPHRIARHPQRRLHADPDVAKGHTTQQEAASQGADASVSQRPPLLFDAAGVQRPQPLAQAVCRHAGALPVLEALPLGKTADPSLIGFLNPFDQLLTTGWQGAKGVALFNHGPEQSHQRVGHVE